MDGEDLVVLERVGERLYVFCFTCSHRQVFPCNSPDLRSRYVLKSSACVKTRLRLLPGVSDIHALVVDIRLPFNSWR